MKHPMAEINDGGPAFPVQDAASWQAHGMSLRDYFAAKALAALISIGGNGTSFGPESKDNNERFSSVAYIMADAMLKARAA